MKKFAIFIALFAVILAAAFAALFSEGVQTKLANKILAENLSGSKVQSVKILPNFAKIENAVIDTDSATLTFKSLTLKYSLLNAIFDKEIKVENLDFCGGVLHIKEKPKAEQNATAQETAKSLSIQKSATEPLAKIAAKETKDQSQSESAKNFGYKISLTNAKADISLLDKNTPLCSAEISVKDFYAGKNFAVQALVFSAKVKSASTPDFISAQASLLDDANGKTLNALASLNGKELLKANGKLGKNFENANLSLSCKATENDIKNFVPLRGAKFACDIFAKLNAQNGLNSVSGLSRILLEGKNLGNINENLNLLSAPKIDAVCEFSGNMNSAQISSLSAEIFDENTPLLKFSLEENAAFNFSNKSFEKAPKIILQLNEIPQSVFKKFIQDADFSVKRMGAVFLIEPDLQKNLLSIKTQKSFYAENISLIKNKRQLLPESLFFSADFNALFPLDFSAQKASGKLYISANGQNGIGNNFSFSGKNGVFEFSVESLGNIGGFLNAKNLSDFSGNIAGSFKDGIVSLKRCDLAQQDNNGAKVLSLSFAGDIDTKKPLQRDFTASINLNNFPLFLLQQFAPNFYAKAASGKLSANNKNSVLDFSGNISAESISYTNGDKYVIKNTDAKANLSGKLSETQLLANAEKISLSKNSLEFFDASGKAEISLDNAAIKNASGKAKIALPKFMDIAAVSDFNNILSGLAEVAFTIKDKDLNLSGKLFNLTPKTKAAKIETMDLSTEIKDFYNLNKATLKTQIFSKQGNSDIEFQANKQSKNSYTLTLNSKRLECNHFAVLAELFNKPKGVKSANNASKTQTSTAHSKAKNLPQTTNFAAANAGAQSAPTQAKKAVWNFGYNISLTSKLNEIYFNEKELAKQLKLLAELNNTSIQIKSLDFISCKTPCLANAKLLFADNFYNLSALNFSAKDADFSDFTKFENSSNNALDGLFDIEISATSKAGTPNKLAENLLAKLSLKNTKGGVLRLIDPDSNTGAVMGIAQSALKIGASLLSDKVKETKGIEAVYSMFREFKFDTLSFALERNADKNIEIKTGEIVGKEITICADGKIAYAENLPFNLYPLSAKGRVYVKNGDTEFLFKKLGLIKSATSPINGYSTGPEFDVYGNLQSPKNNLSEILKDATATGAASLINSFLK